MAAAEPLTPAQIAKAALRRLALAKLEPTPENYAKAWAEESGEAAGTLPPRARGLMERLAARACEDPAARTELGRALGRSQWDEALRLLDRQGDSALAQARAWAQLVERLARGLERGGKHWTLARKKDSLQRVLESSSSDSARLLHRLRQLVSAWDSDEPLPAEAGDDTAADAPSADELPPVAHSSEPAAADATRPGTEPDHWPRLVEPLHGALLVALPDDSPRARALADELAGLADRIAAEGPSPALAAEIGEACQRARRLLAHRHHLLDQVHRLSRELAGGLAELAEDDSWVQGQLQSLQLTLDEAPSARAVQAASGLLARTRERQRSLRGERDLARQALKDLIQRMLAELGELDEHTGRFQDGMLRYAQTIERADSLESLAGVVREMVDESRSVHALVSSTRGRLHDEHARATLLETKVRELEQELRRLSDEVATDQLTQVANRRGLVAQFEQEQSRLQRDGGELAVGLLDIDNFKRLNDSLGHAAGDQALVALARHVRASLRPVDGMARFGGEEFVVLLPGTAVDEAARVLTRLQRELSASLFMHDGQEVFVTFSAGVTAYRPGEALEAALERADEALYEAKRTGKNRTCIA
ncbi:diguanylate cyclase [Ideonella sp. 4Y16]|uniref:GGDEF domain-containing protein n=1 Tax=Ideonella alba TaxID=2824118 RepID=UPI001B379C42|nr:GGDEF domain-containing protein [Ideonella alba]MBQ0944048.1 diguanylate cyclase [Ideonella alba]